MKQNVLFSKSEIAKMTADAKTVAKEANKRHAANCVTDSVSFLEDLFRLRLPPPLPETRPDWQYTPPKNEIPCMLDGVKPGTVVGIACPCPRCCPSCNHQFTR